MNTLILMRYAIRALMIHAVRSLLTILGIMIGIAAIIVTFSIGRGAEQKVAEQILSMGEGAVYIIPGNIVERGQVRSSSSKPAKVHERDVEAILKQCPGVIEISRGHEDLQLIERAGASIKERIYGVETNMLKINNNTLEKGSFFSDYHLNHRMNVVVLGNKLASKFFADEDPLNQTILINKQPFTVIGVLNPVDFFWGTNDPNNRAYVPFTVADKLFRKQELSNGDLGFIALKINPDEKSGKTLRQIKRVLRFMHAIDNGDADDFTIFDQVSISQSAQEASGIIKLFGLIAASISLLVGGIGIMNIMLVSVAERRKEIGISLALGATQGMIQFRFLIEAIMLSIIGGILGIVFGFLLQTLLSHITKLPGIIEFIPLLFSFIITVFIGIFFGYYPARQASLLNPVDALMDK